MKSGRTLTEVAAEIERQATSKRDFVTDSRDLTMLNGNEILVGSHGEFGVRDLAHRQLATHLGIPATYYDRLRAEGYTDILDFNVNRLLRKEPSQRMVRTIDGQVRAVLSNRYQRRDNADLFKAIFPIIAEIPDVQFPSVEITETRLYVKFVAPRIQGEVKTGDIVQAGGVISNSEVGLGSLQASSMFYRLSCLNGAIVETGIRKYHVGRQVNVEENESTELFSDATMRLDDQAFWAKVADVTRATVNETNFNRLLVKMRAAAESKPVEKPLEAVRELTNRYDLSDTEGDSILSYLSKGGDLTRWGVLNAVTRASQDVENYDRATELESLGGIILNMGEKDWQNLSEEPTPVRRRRGAQVTADSLIDSIGGQ